MEIEYLTVFSFDYREIAGKCGEIDWKRLDFRKNKDVYKTGNTLVYLEIDFPTRKPGEDVKKPEYSGEFAIRRIKQTVRNHPGVTKGYTAILLDESPHAPGLRGEVAAEVKNIIAKYAKEGGLISLP